MLIDLSKLRNILGARLGGASSPIQTGVTFNETSDTEVLGFVGLYACTDTSAPRVLVIKSADVAVATPEQPWVFSVKDQSGAAGTNSITVISEGGVTIDGVGLIVISTDFGSVALYSDGSNLFSL